MITFDQDNQRFNFRVAGIAVNSDKPYGIDSQRILLHRLNTDNFWTFPGGRVELGETSQEALVRELKEELNADIEIISKTPPENQCSNYLPDS